MSNDREKSGTKTRAKIPLRNYPLFHTADLGLARDLISVQFREHALEARTARCRFDIVQNTAVFGKATLSYLDYGAPVQVRAGPLETFVLVIMPLSGGALFETNGQQFVCNQRQTLVMPPDDPFVLKWNEDCRALILRIDRNALESKIARDKAISNPTLRLRPTLDAELGIGRLLRHTTLSLVNYCDEDTRVAKSDFFRSGIEEMMIDWLAGHSETHLEDKAQDIARPRSVAAAMDYISTYPEKNLSLNLLASVAGVSGRALQAAFKKHCGASPIEHIRTVRLNCARTDLLSAQSSVTEVGMKWGFFNLGRFSQYYERQFGELPSQTLRKS